jgi:hypothetical protein
MAELLYSIAYHPCLITVQAGMAMEQGHPLGDVRQAVAAAWQQSLCRWSMSYQYVTSRTRQTHVRGMPWSACDS